MKPGGAQPHQSPAPSPRCPCIPQTHSHSLCPCLLCTYQELRSGETSFLPCRTQPGRRWFIALSPRESVWVSHLWQTQMLALLQCRFAQSTPSHSPPHPSVPAVKSESNNDWVGSVYETIPILWLLFCMSQQYGQSDGGMQSSHCQLQLCPLHLVAEWPRAGGTVPTLGHRDTSDLHMSSAELRGNSSAVRWAQRQLQLSQRAQPPKLIEQGRSGFEMMEHLQDSTHLAPPEPSWTQGAQAAARVHDLPTQLPRAKAKSPAHCPSHSPISLHNQGLGLEAGKKNKHLREICKRLLILFMQIRTLITNKSLSNLWVTISLVRLKLPATTVQHVLSCFLSKLLWASQF